MNETDPYLVYLDEAGDHSLESIDRDFPVFVLCMVIVKQSDYVNQLVPDVMKLKFKYFSHEGVILHSRDIRKSQNDFTILKNETRRNSFMLDINDIINSNKFVVISSTINKLEHYKRYGQYAFHPYHLALKFCLERLVVLLENEKQKKVLVCGESRGKREDQQLRLEFYKNVTEGTEYISSSRFKSIDFKIELQDKKKNLIGHQLADLIAYPIARRVLQKNKENKPFEMIRKHFYDGPGAVYGHKIFP